MDPEGTQTEGDDKKNTQLENNESAKKKLALNPKLGLWSISISNTTRPSGFGHGGGSGPTSVWTNSTSAYNTAVNFVPHTKKFLDVDEVNFSVNVRRLFAHQSSFGYNLFAFKEKLNFDKYHYNNEAPLHLNIGGSSDLNFLYKSGIRLFGTITLGAGIILGAPRFDDNQNAPDLDSGDPNKKLTYGEVNHHGGYVKIPPTKDAPKYWTTGVTSTIQAKLSLQKDNYTAFAAARGTVSLFSKQSVKINEFSADGKIVGSKQTVIPKKSILSFGIEFGLTISPVMFANSYRKIKNIYGKLIESLNRNE